MYSNDELESILIRTIGSHQSLDMKKHLIEAVTKVFERLETDEVQAFIARNKHQYGYIMQEASRQWIKEDCTGALTVGPCNLFIEKYGDYHKLQDENEGLKQGIVNSYRDIEELQQDKADLEQLAFDLGKENEQLRNRNEEIISRKREWIRKAIYNLNVCNNQSDLISEQCQEITYLRKEFTITQNNYDMLWKDHRYLIADFVKLQDERGVIREQF